ncbi:MAG: RagB/SusD family nutrient uptake outer membrane protein [Bacteroidales bacterium]|nr:RagB/SusD family nutrient uptake outer membrane protein [Bacteroidales bacterium]
MKKQIYFLTVFTLLTASTGCSGFLDVMPENSQVADDYWQTEADVENVLVGGYYYLRSTVVPYLIPWGECRAGLVYNAKSNNRLQNWQMQASSTSLCNWSTFYQIINVANTVLARADEACQRDETYSESARNSHYTEAYFLRALSYFYLVRNFRDVPLALEAYEDDNIQINLPKTGEDTVIMQIKRDIQTALRLGAAKESFPTTWETKGRATKWALYALMADVCLWHGDYQEAIDYCDALLNADNVKAPALLSSPSRSVYMSIFNPGNSVESIFEIQWNYEEGQTNDLPRLFDDADENATYAVSAAACNDVVREYVAIMGDDGTIVNRESARTWRASFFPGGTNGMSLGMTKGYVWKFVGSTTEDKKRTSTYYDPNFILYRMADILLIKAEALILVDGAEPSAAHRDQAVGLLCRLRARAGYLPAELDDYTLTAQTMSQGELLELVLDERKLEFLGEGKIWYDFLRMGRRNNNQYKESLLTEQVVKYNASASESWLRSVLISDNALFLPIMDNEIERNPNLVQNPYYK